MFYPKTATRADIEQLLKDEDEGSHWWRIYSAALVVPRKEKNTESKIKVKLRLVEPTNEN